MQGLRRLEGGTIQVSVATHLIDQFGSAELVHPTEWATREWREAQSKDGTDISLLKSKSMSISLFSKEISKTYLRIVENLLLQAQDRLIHETRHHTQLVVLHRVGTARLQAVLLLQNLQSSLQVK